MASDSTSRPAPIISQKARVPGIGKGGHKIRGTAQQRREMYEQFRAHTDEVRERLMEIIRNPLADNGHVIQAGKEILSRGWGAAPQVSVIEQVFQHEHTVNMDSLKQMSADELKLVEGFLTRLVAVEDADDAEIIEHDPEPDPED